MQWFALPLFFGAEGIIKFRSSLFKGLQGFGGRATMVFILKKYSFSIIPKDNSAEASYLHKCFSKFYVGKLFSCKSFPA
jgi:hypothetical protein